jgi:hypothetical protein
MHVDMRNACKIVVGKPVGRDQSEELGVDQNIMLFRIILCVEMNLKELKK